MPRTPLLKRDNHYVPSLYLKRWAPDGQVPTYRLLVPHENVPLWKRHSLKGIAYYRNLYTYVSIDGETDEFEVWLDRTFEAPAEAVIARAVNGGKMSPSDWQVLIRFTAAQDVRTPKRLQEFLSRQSKSMPNLMDGVLKDVVEKLTKGVDRPLLINGAPNAGLPHDLFRVRITDTGDGMATIATETTVGRRMWIEVARWMLTGTISRLLEHRWTIWRAPPGVTWPTSDTPVMRLNFAAGGHYDLRGGWARTGGEIFMPLSPTMLLYTKIGDRPPPRGSIMPEPLAHTVRRMLVENAHRLVFDETESDAPLLRPRHIDAAACAQEAKAWLNWDPEQSAAEKAAWASSDASTIP